MGAKKNNQEMIPYNLYLLFVCLYFISTPLRTFNIFQSLILLKIFLPLTLASMVIISMARGEKRVYIDSVMCLFLFMFLQSFFVGLLRKNNEYYIVSDLTTLFITFFTYFFSSNINISAAYLGPFLHRTARFLFTIGTLVVGFDYFVTYYMGISSYLSFGESYLLFPFCYYLFYTSKIRLCIVSVAIFCGGRVGLIIAALAAIFVYYLLFKNKKGVLIKSLSLFICFSVLLNLVMYGFKDYQVPADALPVLHKLQDCNYYTYQREHEELGNYGAGRVFEIQDSYAEFSNLNAVPFITGAGSGFVYKNSGDDEQITHNVHLSVVTILERYGMPLTVIFYISWLALNYRSFKSARTSDVDEKQVLGVMSCFCVGMFIFSFTAFTVFAELFVWFFLGFNNSIRRNKV